MKKLLGVALAALLSLPHLVHAQAYRCKQADGSLGFQDHPCEAGASGSLVALPPVAGYSPGTSSASSGFDRRDQDSSRQRSNAQTDAYNAQVRADNQAIRCNAARQQLGILQEQRPVYNFDASGNRVYVEDKDRPAAVAAAQDRVSSACP